MYGSKGEAAPLHIHQQTQTHTGGDEGRTAITHEGKWQTHDLDEPGGDADVVALRRYNATG